MADIPERGSDFLRPGDRIGFKTHIFDVTEPRC
jgi:hypothetical protein